MTRSRTQLLLAAVVLGELVVGGVLVGERLSRPTPPVPDLSDADPATATELRRLAANCHTTAEWAALGEAYLATGYFPEAEACYRRAVELDPVKPDLAFRHAVALERIGRIEESSGQYRKAATGSFPRAADCWYYVGRNHLRSEQPGPAAEAFGRSAVPAARFELALLSARAGKTTGSDAEAAKLAGEFPTAYPPAALRYRLALARDDRSAAARFADQFARRPRPLPTPLEAEVDWIFGVANGFGRGGLFRDAGRDVQDGRLAQAEAKLREALAARWEPEIADRLAEVVFSLGRPVEAEGILADAVGRGGPSFELLWRLGQARDVLGRPDEALALWERAARTAAGPRARELWNDLAERYERTGRAEKGVPFRVRAYLAAATDALSAGRPEEAARQASRASEDDPQSARAWFVLGEAHRFAGRAEEARSAYEKCLRIDPGHGRATRSLALLGE